MKIEDLKIEISELNDKMLFADGFEKALVGYVERCGTPTVALYDYDRCIQILMKRDKMTREEALEFFEFNTLGAYVGESTPAFATFLKNPGPSKRRR